MIAIKAEMPKDCGKCFVGDRTLCSSGCPLIEIHAPHGRLIDIDDAIESYGERAELGYVSQANFLNVVIEAEGSEE